MENNDQNENKLPKWTKPKVNFVGINLNELSPEQLKKLVDLMEDIGYEPIQFAHDSATKD